MVNNKQTVINLCSLLGIKIGNIRNIKNVIFEESFNTYTPTSLKEFFRDCTGLNEITGLKYLNIAEVTDMSYMFWNCRNLSSLDIPNFNTAKVTDMLSMFYLCQKLTELNLSNFKTEKVKNMSNMFSYCNMLEKLNLSNFNTTKVEDMSYMFNMCQKLTELNLSNFNTANVTNMSSMFYGCSTLQTIYVSDDFVVTGITKEDYKKDMFTGCKVLKGALTEYDANKTGSEYANYKTGYFTKLVGMNGDEKIGAAGETLTAASLALNDDKDLVVYDPFTATAASYNRDIKTGTTWGTLCLPFEVSLDEQNFRAFELGSVNNSEVVLKELNATIPAGTPIFIKMNEGQTALNFSVADKKIEKDAQTAATTDGGYQLVGIYATKMFDKTDNNCYILKNGKLMNPAKILNGTSTEAVGSKPFRAYMEDNSSSASGAKMFGISENGSNPTDIDQLTDTLNDSNAVYYDLQGHRLSQPQKGINILKVGNKTMKVIIK